MNLIRASITVASILALCTPSRANPAPSIHYAPAENLEHVDVALIDAAKHEIDLAAYILTRIMQRFDGYGALGAALV